MEEKEAVLRGLELALKMEADGKKYYQYASSNSTNEAGQKLFASLAAEEDEHSRRFYEIYKHIKETNTWPDAGIKAASGKNIRTVFAESLAEANKEGIKWDTEMKAVEAARKMEDESISLYTHLESLASSEAEKRFFEDIIAEEREHSLSLNDYAEYLRDPAGWFVAKEHHSLDGS